MALMTSNGFAAAMAAGNDWRDTAKSVLEQLQEAQRTSGQRYTLGFLYISDHLAADATSICNLFRSVLNVPHWTGCVGIGLCGNGQAIIDKPAISAMLAAFPEESFSVFGGENDETPDGFPVWLQSHDPAMLLVHGNAHGEEDPLALMRMMENVAGGYLVGGLSSSRTQVALIADEASAQWTLTGVALGNAIPVASVMTQGCQPIGPAHTITRGIDTVISELDNRPAPAVLDEDIAQAGLQDRDKPLREEIHIAFPITQSDGRDYMVRNILSVDHKNSVLNVTQNVFSGETVMFVLRSEETLREDLSRRLLALRERVKKEHGQFAPRGALYISCMARAFDQESGQQSREMELIRDIIGAVPLTGFYAAGEISNSVLHAYTGILVLFP